METKTQNGLTAIDGRMLGATASGVATYAEALSNALAGLGEPPLVVSDNFSRSGLQRAKRVESWSRWLDARWDRPRSLRPRKAGLFAQDIFRLAQVHFDAHGSLLRLRAPGASRIMHWTYPLPVIIEGWTNIYTVHDIIPISHPDLSPINGDRLRAILAAIVRQGGHFMTVSSASRNAIAEATASDIDTIFACHTGLNLEQPGADLPCHLVRREYYLVAGSVEPRKNIARVVDAWSASGSKRPLVVAGPTGWHGEAIEAGLADREGVIRLPDVRRETLLSLIANARALLFPTLAEGFGLPIVEAMILGTPVLAPGRGATGEIMAGAGMPIEPEDIADMAEAISRIDRDDNLCTQLISAGIERARHFTLDAFTDRIAAIHRNLASNSDWHV